MASLNSKIIHLKAKEFNKLRAKLMAEGIGCYLLSKDGRTGDFNIEFVVPDWYPVFNSFREQVNIQVATEDPDFVEALHKSSDVAIGVSICEVYEIVDRDIVAPNGDRPWWQLFSTRGGEAFYV
jgi:hypothetical protein